VLHDLRPLVGTADHRTELARLVVVEPDHCARLFVVGLPEEVELPDAVVVQDHGQPAAAVESEGELRPDAGKPRLTQVDGHLVSSLRRATGRSPWTPSSARPRASP